MRKNRSTEPLRNHESGNLAGQGRATSTPDLRRLGFWMLLSGIGILTAMSGAAVILTGSSSGPAVLLVVVVGSLVGSAAWRRMRELLEPAAPEVNVHEAVAESCPERMESEVLIPAAVKAGAGA